MSLALTSAARRTDTPAAKQMSVGLIVAALFGVFLIGGNVGLSSVERLAFSPVAMVVGAWLLAKGRREDYIAFVFWLFILSPWLRRVIDLHAGFAQVNLLMLAPYAAGMLSFGPVITLLKNRRFAYSSIFAVVFACVTYGLLVATVNGRLFAALFDTVRWAVPPSLGLLVALDVERLAGYRAAVLRTMTLAMILTGVYGIYQYVVAPPWDTAWMRASDLSTIGVPEPYGIRVFGTMNSPGSFAVYLMAGLLWVVPATGAARFPAIALGLIALLLTLLRTSWLGLLVGFAYLVVFGTSARARLSILGGLVCLPLVLLGMSQIPQGAEVITSRLESLVGVQSDASFQDRAHEYDEFFYRVLPEQPFGVGLGVNGSYSSYVDTRVPVMVDGAFMEIGMALGALAGGLYLFAVLVAAMVTCWSSLHRRDTFLSSCAAIVVALTLSLVSGTVTVGEVGVLFWMSVGFCLAPAPAPASVRAAFGARA